MIARRLLVLGLAVGALLSGVAVWIWIHDDPIRRAERTTGLDFPNGTRVIHFEEQWTTFLGDGYSLTVLSVPNEFTRAILEGCEERGFSTGTPEQAGTRIFKLEQYVRRSDPACYSEPATGATSVDVVVQPGTIAIYLSVS